MRTSSLILIPAAVLIVILLLVARVMYSPSESSTAVPPPAMADQASKTPELITDPAQVPTLVEAPGRDAFTVNCTTCHTVRYVLMQPKFSRKIWTAEVTKMVNAYKAPISPAQQEEIVNYVVAAYGQEN